MQKKPLLGISIAVVCLIVLASLSNVVGVQTVQSSNQKAMNDVVNQKELLFQTIVDIANNKEIQKIIFKSQMGRENFFNPDARFSIFNTPVLTKNQLKHMYVAGLMISKTISISKLHSMLERHQVSNQGLQKEITTIIEKDAKLNGEITQLSISKCECENKNTTRLWNFPVICTLLFPLFIIGFGLYVRYNLIYLLNIIIGIGAILNCFWYGG